MAKVTSDYRRGDRGAPLGGRAAALLVVAAAIGAYLPALGNGFVWDDPLILDHQLPAFRTLSDVLVPPSDLPHAGSFYYRPLVFLSYLFDRWAGGGSPVAFHATPIALHALASGLLLLLLWQMLGRGGWAAPTLGALVFALHPVHVEAVAWMAGRGDLLATVGVLAALLAWGRWLDGGSAPWLLAGGVALLLGLLSKEVAVAGTILAAALPWVWPARQPNARRAAWPLWTSIAASVLVAGLLRGTAFGVTPGATRAAGSSQLAIELLGALGFYTAGLLWPAQPGVVLAAAPTSWSALGTGLTGTALLALAAGAALWRRAALPAWGLLWIGAALFPALLLVLRYISETPVAERYLYLPSAGAALLVAWAFVKVPPRWRTVATTAAAVALVAMAVVTARRTLLWHDEIAFWSNAVALAPTEGPPHLKLAAALIARGDLAGAEAAYSRGLTARLSPEQQSVAQVNLARLLLMRGDAQAEPLARAALTAPQPDLVAQAAFLLGHAQLARQNAALAATWFEYAVRVAPRSTGAAEARAALARLAR